MTPHCLARTFFPDPRLRAAEHEADNGTAFYTTTSLQPTTVPVPTTQTTTGGSSATSPATVTAGADSQNRPAVAFLAGVFGLLALF